MNYPITLQRASAGSGKTYTLTKKFIRLLISIAKDGGSPRLRNEAELRDALNHILAVTFTNKATDEMKQRIMSCLSALAAYRPGQSETKPAYLDDFKEEFGVDDEEISRRCQSALKYLLYNYSEFKVHTIDAFFQSMLRTFAYESDLPDGYEVIVDNQYLNKQVVIDLLSDIRRGTANAEVRNWVKRMIRMKEKDGKSPSDVFNFRESTGRSKSLFDEMCLIAKDFDKETNKDARTSLEEYMEAVKEKGIRLEDVYIRLETYFAEAVEGRMRGMVEAACRVIEAGDRIEEITGMGLETYLAGGSRTMGQLLKLSGADPAADAESSFTWKVMDWDVDSYYAGSKFKTKAQKAQIERVTELSADLIGALQDLTEAYQNLMDYKEGEEYLAWKHLSKGFPRVGLLMDLMERARIFLLETGTMRLSDTNTMLSRIIGGDDLAFIYERYGSRLDHFLIDEFQDTSLMQWENFLPLLNNSKSYLHENLIIGDAKQSIYRFRGADPTLITERVPAEFSGYIDERGNLEEENANRRSSRRIVEFNNYIFRALSSNLVVDYGERIERLYGNTVQRPANDVAEGYVEIDICRTRERKSKGDYDEDNGTDGSVEGEVSGSDGPVSMEIKECLRDRIFDLLRRGYQQREIAILVNTNSAGKDVIAYLRDCNKNLPPDVPLLEFVSEDSLTLGSSRSVECVIDCLRMIQKGVEGAVSYKNIRAQDTMSNSLIQLM
ncbi:MAG: UvrD-helicase domain-containing protein [Muribaculaceae bacterium]|nr:UvrD-helicase domain-containing protein [Muribaculaceae bacterium]